ncbi:TIGR02466 family protein [Picosynechococcus sp. NKBG042902]|uniref:TIGR02466 family protein n=1 Tax=Picosynechococcus sp. NKBG042902 TaxID=490193 RepID=UPI001377A942|nr:TIGR02466 family protein [Picosynechococcus sp. NKBG042902]
MTDAWINHSPPGAYNKIHIHPGANISGVIYLQAPENCGNISFVNPYSYFCAAEDTYTVVPKKGMGLLFNSRLPHYVDVNHSEEDRISMAFNMRFTDLPLKLG